MVRAAVLTLALVYLNNTSHLAEPIGPGPWLIAHRGLSQGFDREGLTAKTCTAARMLPRQHGFLENTIPAMKAAFAYGASAVELDVHRTADGRFVVFHDWIVDCRTEGAGVTREHTLAELQALDIGYGYTADGGQTFPFRGQGGLRAVWSGCQPIRSRVRGRRLFVRAPSSVTCPGHSQLTGLASYH